MLGRCKNLKQLGREKMFLIYGVERKMNSRDGFHTSERKRFYLVMFFHVLFEVQKGIEMLLLKCYY